MNTDIATKLTDTESSQIHPHRLKAPADVTQQQQLARDSLPDTLSPTTTYHCNSEGTSTSSCRKQRIRVLSTRRIKQQATCHVCPSPSTMQCALSSTTVGRGPVHAAHLSQPPGWERGAAAVTSQSPTVTTGVRPPVRDCRTASSMSAVGKKGAAIEQDCLGANVAHVGHISAEELLLIHYTVLSLSPPTHSYTQT